MGKEGNGSQLLKKDFSWLISDTIKGRSRQHILICTSLKVLPCLHYTVGLSSVEWEKGSWMLEVEIPSYYSKKLMVLCQRFLLHWETCSKVFSSPRRRGRENIYLLFACNFILKNYHLKRTPSCSGGLTKLLSFFCCFFFAVPWRLNTDRQTDCEVSVILRNVFRQRISRNLPYSNMANRTAYGSAVA